MNLLQNKSIAIIGGGPGGLTLARLLQLHNCDVKVYDRDINQHVRVQGATLDLHEESGLEALRRAGLMDEFKANFRPGADKMVVVNEHAEIFFSDHETKQEEDFGDKYFRPEIDRGPLRNILLGSLKPGTMVWNSHFISLQKSGDGWLLHFKNGRQHYADIVIGADGANSKIRPYLTDIKPFYSGVTAIEGNVHNAAVAAPAINTLLRGGKIFAYGYAQVVIVSSKAGGDLTFYTSCKTSEDWAKSNGLDYADNGQLLAWFKNEFSGWGDIWHELFTGAGTPFIPRPIYSMPLSQSWQAQPNLTLLGDAAHLMPPFAGEGVNMAMLDAVELCDSLTAGSFISLQDSIAAYETHMRKRAAAAAHGSLLNTEWMHSSAALETMVQMFTGSTEQSG